MEVERFRPLLTKGLGDSGGTKGGRPVFDPVGMFKVQVTQARHNLSVTRWTVKVGGKIRYRPVVSPPSLGKNENSHRAGSAAHSQTTTISLLISPHR